MHARFAVRTGRDGRERFAFVVMLTRGALGNERASSLPAHDLAALLTHCTALVLVTLIHRSRLGLHPMRLSAP